MVGSVNLFFYSGLKGEYLYKHIYLAKAKKENGNEKAKFWIFRRQGMTSAQVDIKKIMCVVRNLPKPTKEGSTTSRFKK